MIAPSLPLGVGFHAAGALLSANCYAPQKYIRRWSWEVFWMTQAAWCWLLWPIIGALATIPRLGQVLTEGPHDRMWLWDLVVLCGAILLLTYGNYIGERS